MTTRKIQGSCSVNGWVLKYKLSCVKAHWGILNFHNSTENICSAYSFFAHIQISQPTRDCHKSKRNMHLSLRIVCIQERTFVFQQKGFKKDIKITFIYIFFKFQTNYMTSLSLSKLFQYSQIHQFYPKYCIYFIYFWGNPHAK